MLTPKTPPASYGLGRGREMTPSCKHGTQCMMIRRQTSSVFSGCIHPASRMSAVFIILSTEWTHPNRH